MPDLRWKHMKIAHGSPPRGCVLCEKGAKMVLLVTGLCGAGCYYCPLSERKMGKDVVFANEMQVDEADIDSILREGRMIDALGTGITGGDPLRVLDRTLGYINELKEAFGSKHHIHLYTGTADTKAVSTLANAGLDEIRFHPPPGSWKQLPEDFIQAVSTAHDGGIEAGFEIPALPDMKGEILSLMDALEGLEASFLNLNELEFSETNLNALLGKGFKWRSETSNAMRGSEKVGMQVLHRAHDLDLNLTVHLCSSAYKDAVQLRNRLKRRAKNVANSRNVITDDGTLLRGVIETKDPVSLLESLKERFELESTDIGIRWGSVEVSPWVLEEIASEIGEKCFIVEEYPTHDRLEVERTPLN